MLLGSRLEQRREELLLTVDEIASFVGVRTETVNNWEHGLSNPQKANLQALAKILQTTTDYLEGNTDIARDYSSCGNKCIICGKSIPYGISKCPECCWRKWPASFITSNEQAKRRKRSHSVILSSLDREKARAKFTSVTSWGVNTYETSLDMCTCPDFEDRHMPCKHIFRLADELGLFKSETFAPGERDYTMEFTPQSATSVNNREAVKESEAITIPSTLISEPPAVTPEPVKPDTPDMPQPSGILMKVLKYALCCFFSFWAVIFTVGAITQGKEWLCFPVGFAVAGFLTANTARRKSVDGSSFKWWLYGALVPVMSWIDVVMANAQNKTKGFLKGIAYSILGIMVFLMIFVQFLPSVSTR